MIPLGKPLEQILGIGALFLLAIGCAIVLLPFLSALLWAAVICFSTWPIYIYISPSRRPPDTRRRPRWDRHRRLELLTEGSFRQESGRAEPVPRAFVALGRFASFAVTGPIPN
jgi:hypothetical protein